MLPLETLHVVSLVLFATGLCWAAVTDFLSLRIANATSLAIVLLYPAFVLTHPGTVDWLAAVAIALVVFVLGAVAFAMKKFGGGDVKLLAAAALWAGPEQIGPLLFATAFAGGGLALISMSRARLWLPYLIAAGGGDIRGRALMKLELPYGVAIAIGGLVVVWRLAGL